MADVIFPNGKGMRGAVGRRLSQALRSYYCGPDHPMKLRLWGWLRNLQQHRKLTVTYCNRGWLTLDERDLVQRYVLREGFYEPEVWDALFKFATHSEVLWDIGGHIGTFTVRSALDCRVRLVHTFEPDPVTFEALENNVRVNSLGNTCRIHRCALGSENCATTLYRGPVHNIGLSSIDVRPTSEGHRVLCRSIDDLVFRDGLEPPTLVKIDVEGFEEKVLIGAERLLRELPPKAIAIEALSDESTQIVERSLVHCLKSFHFDLRWIPRPSGIVHARENYIAARLCP